MSSTISQFVWHDCLTTDIDKAIEYFSHLTDWVVFDQTSPNVGRYPIVRNRGKAIAGILEMPAFLRSSGIPPYWTGYVHTNLEQAAENIAKLGGQIFTMPNKSAMGTSFVFTDSGGAVLACYAPSNAFEFPAHSKPGDLVWQQLYSANHEKSSEFYRALLGWEMDRDDENSVIFRDSASADIAGMGHKPDWIDSDTWVYFIGVGDISDTVERALEQGGSVLDRLQIKANSAVVLKDALGCVIGFYEC